MTRLTYLLMTPPIEVIRQKRDIFTEPMMSVGYLASALRNAGFDAEIFDPKYEGLNFDESFKRVKEISPSFVGISSMTHEIVRAHKFATILKEWNKDIFVAVGGAHATSLPLKTMEEFPNFDFLVAGEGEEAIVELASYLEVKETDICLIKGLLHRNNGEIKINPDREWSHDLDSISFPAWDMYPKIRKTAFPLLASRGCPYSCLFCMRVLGSKQRRRSPEAVADEMEWLVKNFSPSEIYLEDETFGIDKKWVYKICDGIQSKGLHEQIKWTANIRANLTTEDFLVKIKESGCYSVGIGVESGNERILKSIKKRITLKQVEEVVKMCKKLKLEVRTYFILGHPNETLKTAIDTIKFAAKLKPSYAVFGIMVPYPRTGIAEMIERNEGGYRPISTNWADFDKHIGNALELESLSRRRLEMLQMFAYLYFYSRNFRFIDLLKFIFNQRTAIFSMVKKILKI
jgi:anaerobic magnesium-protoporphyrin IX monomethyl ester cyclase